MALNQSYVRERLFAALTNEQRSGKGQLAAFEDSPIAYTDRYPRKRHRTIEIGTRKISADTDPVCSTETRSRKSPSPLIGNVEYQSSSWRRAVMELEGTEKAWVQYCYGYSLDFTYQTAICRHVWESFQQSLVGRRVTDKVKKRLAALVWLAVQEQAMICGRAGVMTYSDKDLAAMSGVAANNWSQKYSAFWSGLKACVAAIDSKSLTIVTKIRTEQTFRVKSLQDDCKSEVSRALSRHI